MGRPAAIPKVLNFGLSLSGVRAFLRMCGPLAAICLLYRRISSRPDVCLNFGCQFFTLPAGSLRAPQRMKRAFLLTHLGYG